jgi:hypothetical protein
MKDSARSLTFCAFQARLVLRKGARLAPFDFALTSSMLTFDNPDVHYDSACRWEGVLRTHAVVP